MRENALVRFNYEMRIIAANRLTSDQKYQRNLSPTQLRKIKEGFDWNLVNPIKVSLRDGKYYVMDGQHTLSDIIAIFGEDTLVPIMLFTGLTYQKEAQLTAKFDELKRKMSKVDTANALIEAEDDDILRFIDICESCGYKAEFSSGITKRDYYVQNPYLVYEAVYKKHGEKFLKQILAFFSGAYQGRADCMRSPVLKGVIRFMEVYENEYNEKTLVRSMSGILPDQFKQNAKIDKHLREVDRYGNTVRTIYNTAAKKKLIDKFEEAKIIK